VEINNSSLSNSPNAVKTSVNIINVSDTLTAIYEMRNGIIAIYDLPIDTRVDPVHFLTDSKKVLQQVNTVAKAMIGAIISSTGGVPVETGPLFYLMDPSPEVVILVPFLSRKKY
jgi:hypothetical protein